MNSTQKDVSDLYFLAWRLGVKVVALYRDGSKLNQPLNASWDNDPILEEQDFPTSVPPQAARLAEQVIAASKRRKLPSRRNGYTQKYRVGGHALYCRTGEYKDGTLGEIFLDFHREGEAFRAFCHCFAIAISLGLQHGVPLEEFVDAFTFLRFEPSGLVDGHDRIKMSTSIVDCIFRDLAITYLGREDLAHTPPPEASTTTIGNPANERNPAKTIAARLADPQVKKSAVQTAAQRAREFGYTGDPCHFCGQLTLVQSGTCKKCDTCGETSGCS